MQVMSDTVQGESLLAKTYGIFKLLGFGSLPYLEPADQAALAGIEKYCKFRQGDMWRAMGDEFEATGMRPTAPDRCRRWGEKGGERGRCRCGWAAAGRRMPGH